MGKYQTYPEYKDSKGSWLGSIPSHWIPIPLKRVCTLCTGLTPPTSNESNYVNHDSELPWVRPEDISEENNETKASKFLSQEGWGLMRVVSKGSTLICCIGTIGKSGYVQSDVTTNQQITAASFHYSQKFNYYLVQAAKEIMKETATGNVILILNSERLGGIPFLSIPQQEADKIAKFLDHETAKIDQLIEKQQQLIKLLKEKRQAVISHAVTKGLNPDAPMKDSGVKWLGEVPAHWDVLPIKYIVSTPVTDGPHETPDFHDEGIPFVSAEAISSGKVDFNKIRAHISEEDNVRYSLKYSPKKYDIYMVKSGATTGITAIVETEKVFNIWSPLAVIRCNKDSYPYFVLNFLRSLNFQEAVELNWSFGTQQNIGMGVIENLHVVKPPIVEAKQIVKELNSEHEIYDSIIEKVSKQIELMKERRTALISAAVTGKIDVRNWENPDA